MSEQDRGKWNARYRDGAYESRVHASAIVERWAPEALQSATRAGREGSPRALDIACGAGRNAMALAGLGFAVDALDIADEGLERARSTAAARGLVVDWRCVDLDDGLPAEFTGYDLIVVIRFLNRALLPLLCDRLRPGGLLVCEIHALMEKPSATRAVSPNATAAGLGRSRAATDEAVIGPTSPQFRLAPGELARLVPNVAIVEQAEGVFDDPDGRPVALARLVGRRAG